jgi:RNA polymerase sporulation-specific sigma factor
VVGAHLQELRTILNAVALDPAGARLADEELVARYRAGEPEALDLLLHRYRRFARAKARGYFLVGADSDDIEQEGMIGLYKAVRDYRADREAGFRAFAELCITRQVISAIKGANRLKHQPMDRYVSISGVYGGESEHERVVEDLLDDHHVVDPADEVCQRERMADMQATMHELFSGLEVEVLGLYVEGRSYQEIGASLGRHVKSIDNALQRIKKKLEQHVTERDAAERAEEAAS